MRRILPLLAILVGLGAVGGAGFMLATKRYEVEGDSMLPAYKPGDRVVVSNVGYSPGIGDVVVVRQNGSNGRLDVKRIAGKPGDVVEVRGEPYTLGPDEWYVAGDNAGESVDSRRLGPVSRSAIMGRVLFKY
jgi:signal peptidase I